MAVITKHEEDDFLENFPALAQFSFILTEVCQAKRLKMKTTKNR